MASYFCPECGDDYPKAKIFDDCPVCNTNTLFRAQHDPNVSQAEGERRVRSKENHAAFIQWCSANGRTENDPPRGLILYLPSDATANDQRLAKAVAVMLDRRFPSIGELHVVVRGL